MKISEMNKHQREAFRCVCEASGEYIGGWENTMLDYPEDHEEYKNAQTVLSRTHEELVDDIYQMVMAESDKGVLRHLRFAGKDFILERIDRRLKKWGY